MEPIEAPYQGASESHTTRSSTRLQKSEAERNEIWGWGVICPPPSGQHPLLFVYEGDELFLISFLIGAFYRCCC